jgi:RNA polymerase sigma-70 factor, ECF subfamily
MPPPNQDSEADLIRRAGCGDRDAGEQLLSRHRRRLRRMISVRMDPRLNARMDPSDVVQEVLAEAARRLPEYVGSTPLPFYPWLRQIAWEQLVKLHRHHLRTQKRSALRERNFGLGLSDQSALALAEHLLASGTSPSGRAMREELRERVRRALGQLDPGDREILVMRHLEQLQIGEIAAMLGISEGAVKMRRLRAAEQLRRLLEDRPGKEEQP